MSRNTTICRAGNALIYATVLMIPLAGILSLAVDLGRVQVTKSQLQAACDNASRQAMARHIQTQGNVDQVIASTTTAMGDNAVDGIAASIGATSSSTGTIQFVDWNSSTKTYTVLSGTARSGADAIRIHASRDVPTIWARILGRNTVRVTAQTVASTRANTGTSGVNDSVDVSVNGEAAVWWANVPSSAPNFGGYNDNAVTNKPVEIILPGGIKSGDPITFTNISGATWPSEWFSYQTNQSLIPGWALFPAEGAWVMSNSSMNGIAGLNANCHGLVGVFIETGDPRSRAAPTALDQGSQASRDLTEYRPALRQPFFIGDGVTSSGVRQTFVAPSGTAKLVLGILDVNGISTYNAGAINVRANRVSSAVVQVD